MRIFLTGATGYVGGAVLESLQARGHTLVALVRSEQAAARLRDAGTQALVGDMCVPGTWADEVGRCDAVVHAAQLRFGRRVGLRWVREAVQADRTCVETLLAGAKRGGRCRAFIYTSGVSAFGDHGDEWIDEATPCTPSALGRFHLEGEQLARTGTALGVPTVVLRPGLPYAPSGTFAAFFLSQAAGGKFGVVGQGNNYMPCEHLDDLAEAYALAVEAPPAGEVISIVDDEPITFRALGELLLQHLGGGGVRGAPQWLVTLFAGRALGPMLGESYRVRNAKAKALLGWRPRHASIREGLPDVVARYRRATKAAG